MDEIEDDDMNLESIQSFLNEMNAHFYDYQWDWVKVQLEKRWGKSIDEIGVEEVVTTVQQWKESVVKLDQLIYDDAKKEFDLDAKIGFGADGDEVAKQQDFENVRGSFEKNPFVLEVLQHIERKSALADELINQLKSISNS
jgi:translation elongation factor EF-G